MKLRATFVIICCFAYEACQWAPVWASGRILETAIWGYSMDFLHKTLPEAIGMFVVNSYYAILFAIIPATTSFIFSTLITPFFSPRSIFKFSLVCALSISILDYIVGLGVPHPTIFLGIIGGYLERGLVILTVFCVGFFINKACNNRLKSDSEKAAAL